MSSFDIRKAQISDFPALVSLFASPEHDGLEDRFRSVISSCDHVLVVAELESSIVGYAMAQGYGPRLRSGEETVRLHDLMVSSEHRRRGVGQALFAVVKDWVNARGARYLEWQSSAAGIAFYESLGLKGDPCPQPEYPFFEIDFQRTPFLLTK
jgi:GNAT superfamily N-acetyltransferase